ncbi:MAG: glycosyltransferase family 4 protein [Pirellulales bacterium]|nr:glycosyltransferase family 4 protein [Pirellulales bacterium]
MTLPRTTRRTASCATSASATGRRPMVLLRGKPGAMQAPGGGEIQRLALAEALPSVGVDARLVDDRPRQAEDDLPAGTDLLHLFGSLPEHLPPVEAARRQGVPVVLSTIAWFALADSLREPRPMVNRLAACARFIARAACPRLPSWRRRLYQSVDLLLPNSNAEAQQLVRYFQVAPERIHIVPNGADERFAEADAEPFARAVGAHGFALYAGRIEPRKNQLHFLRAMRGSGVPIVVLGDVVPGHEWYLAECRRAADPQVRFVPRLPHHDPRLASAYAACGCLVLASWYETPGLVALEAGMSGTPLVLPEGGCACEYFGPRAAYVRPNDLPGIRRAVLAALRRKRSRTLADLIRTNFSWAAAAQATREAYEGILRRHRR